MVSLHNKNFFRNKPEWTPGSFVENWTEKEDLNLDIPCSYKDENLSIAMFVHMVGIILSLCPKSAQTISISVLTQSKIRETVPESWKK
ncbi:hypothetical protein CHS0354_007726, partial [Potamilus streckersoni]